MIFSRVAPLFLASLAPLAAADFPVVPRSDHVLTVEQVKHFWSDHLRSQPLTSGGSPLRPEMQADDRLELRRRLRTLEQIESGEHDLAAHLVCLSHNVEAWSRRGDRAKSLAAEAHLIRIRQHLAYLSTLQTRRQAAEKANDAGEALTALDAEIRELQAALMQLAPAAS